jgi:hypothetical protein
MKKLFLLLIPITLLTLCGCSEQLPIEDEEANTWVVVIDTQLQNNCNTLCDLRKLEKDNEDFCGEYDNADRYWIYRNCYEFNYTVCLDNCMKWGIIIGSSIMTKDYK